MTKYSIKDLTAISQTTEKSVRNLFKTNKELKEMATDHIIYENRNVYYDNAIYEWFCKRYRNDSEEKNPLIENRVGEGVSQSEEAEITKPTARPYVRANDEVIKELKELQIKYDDLKIQFDKVESERQELLKQNGNLLLLLSQEKAEKQKLLPAPRKTIGERIKGLFHKTNAGEGE